MSKKPIKLSNKDFVHWHCHSEYSAFDGLSKITNLTSEARKMGFPALALTDHGNIGGWLKFIKECKATKDKEGKTIENDPIKPILGCLLAGQEIVTEDGVKSVEDVKVGDYVLTHKGRFKKVTKIMSRTHSGKFYRFKLSHNVKRTLVVTDEHPVLISDKDGNTDWLLPKDIIAGRSSSKMGIKQWNSYVCLPKISCQYTKKIDVRNLIPDTMSARENYISQIEKSNKYSSLREWDNIPRFIDLDEEFAYFLGLFCAEGWTCNNENGKNGQFGLSFHINEEEYVDFCIDFLRSRFGINASINTRKERNQTDVYACCLPMAYILSGLCGDNAKLKKVPACIFKASDKIKEQFIRGLIDGDGKDASKESNVNNQETLRVSSKNLAWGFRTLLSNMGHWVSVDEHYDGIKDKLTYTVPFNPYRRYARSIDVKNYILKPISEISQFEDTKRVFNFEVEEDHSYVSDFVLHNCEFYLSRHHKWKGKKEEEENGGFQPDGRSGNRHLNLFAMNWAGYQNLCALSEKSFRDGFYHNPRVDFELLAQHSEGILGSSACLSSVVNANLLHGRYDYAKKTVAKFKDIYGENFFLEAMYHGIPAEGAILPDIIKLGAEMNVPVVATNDAHYIKKEHAKSQEVLMCISTNRCLTDPKHIHFSYGEFYLKSAQEMSKMFYHVPQLITNSVAMLDRIDIKDIERNLFGGMRLPKYEVPEGFEDAQAYITYLAKEGMKRLGWDKSKKHVERLDMELEDVRIAKENNNYDFAKYFLIVQDYIKDAQDKGIVVGCGRGSGFGSVLLRCLDIAYGPDPLEHGLLWQRFLGFDSIPFVKESDFGFKSEELQPVLETEEDREVEDDLGGVDRY